MGTLTFTVLDVGGGENGPGCRPMDIDWVHGIREACASAGVPLFFKQTGEKLAREMGFDSKKGSDSAEWPKG